MLLANKASQLNHYQFVQLLKEWTNYVEGVMQVTRRRIIDEIDQMIDNVEDSLLEVSFDTEITPDPSYFKEEDKT